MCIINNLNKYIENQTNVESIVKKKEADLIIT